MDFSRLETSSKIGDGWRYPAAEPRRSGWLDVDADLATVVRVRYANGRAVLEDGRSQTFHIKIVSEREVNFGTIKW